MWFVTAGALVLLAWPCVVSGTLAQHAHRLSSPLVTAVAADSVSAAVYWSVLATLAGQQPDGLLSDQRSWLPAHEVIAETEGARSTVGYSWVRSG